MRAIGAFIAATLVLGFGHDAAADSKAFHDCAKKYNTTLDPSQIETISVLVETANPRIRGIMGVILDYSKQKEAVQEIQNNCWSLLSEREIHQFRRKAIEQVRQNELKVTSAPKANKGNKAKDD
jgi:hypothetical protein